MNLDIVFNVCMAIAGLSLGFTLGLWTAEKLEG